MAAIISTDLLHYISPVLIFIAISTIIYAVLQRFSLFGKNQPINAAISVMVGLLFIFTPMANSLIKEVVPWLVVLILIFVVVLLLLMFVGYKEESIVKYLAENSFGYIVITVVIIIFIIALAKVFGPSFYQYPAGGETGILSDIKRVILNPKVLAVFLILIIAAKFIQAIAMPTKK